MSLTSYRAAPPRVEGRMDDRRRLGGRFGGPGGDLLFHALRRSTIGAEGFHGRVRDGIGCFAPRYGHQAGQTAERLGPRLARALVERRPGLDPGASCRLEASCACLPKGQVCRPVGPGFRRGIVRPTARVARRVSQWFLPLGAALKPIERLVPVSCAGYPASTSGLSTWWSSTALKETWF